MDDRGLLENTKSILKSLIVSAPTDLSIQQLIKDYRSMEGCDIPYGRLGYVRLEQFLKSIPDTLQVYTQNNVIKVVAVSVKAQHINEMVAHQKNSTKTTKLKSSAAQVTRNFNEPTNNNFLMHNPVSQSSQLLFPNNQNHMDNYLNRLIHPVLFQRQVNEYAASQARLLRQNQSYMNNNMHTYLDNTNTNTFTNAYQSVNYTQPTYYKRNEIKKPTVEIKSYPRETNSPRLQNLINPLQNNKNEPPLRKYGPITKVSDCIEENKTYKIVDNKLTEDLPTENNNTNHTDLNTTTTTDGTDCNLTDLSAAVSDINLHRKYTSQCASMDEAIPELDEDDPIFFVGMSHEIVKYGKKIDITKIPDVIEVGSVFGIFVTEICSPYKFWFHIQEYDSDLDSLMQEIEYFYTKLKQHELRIYHSNIVRGQVCAALFLNMWHRAEIVEYQQSKVKVFFVDYGTVADVEVEDIKYLVYEYSLLRCQALRGCLDYIKPLSHRWARDATFAFLALVNDLLLYAKVTDINRKDRIMHMLLTDTNKAEDIHINDALIQKGYARLNFEVTDNSALPEEKKKRHFSEKYPTFEMLESGTYPSFEEIGILLTKGLDFEALQDENIIPNVDMDITNTNIQKHSTSYFEPNSNTKTLDNTISTLENNLQNEECPNLNKYKIITSGSINTNLNIQPFPDQQLWPKTQNHGSNYNSGNWQNNEPIYSTSSNIPNIIQSNQISQSTNILYDMNQLANTVSHGIPINVINNVSNVPNNNNPFVNLTTNPFAINPLPIRPPPGFEHLNNNFKNCDEETFNFSKSMVDKDFQNSKSFFM